jgi:hypothetical protein
MYGSWFRVFARGLGNAMGHGEPGRDMRLRLHGFNAHHAPQLPARRRSHGRLLNVSPRLFSATGNLPQAPAITVLQTPRLKKDTVFAKLTIAEWFCCR